MGLLGKAAEYVLGRLLNRDPEKERLKQLEEHTREESKDLNGPTGDWGSNVDRLP